MLQEDVWRSNALRTLPVLMGATDMMVCGEDLGMIPACVHPVMERLGLLGEGLPKSAAAHPVLPQFDPLTVLCI